MGVADAVPVGLDCAISPATAPPSGAGVEVLVAVSPAPGLDAGVTVVDDGLSGRGVPVDPAAACCSAAGGASARSSEPTGIAAEAAAPAATTSAGVSAAANGPVSSAGLTNSRPATCRGIDASPAHSAAPRRSE